MSPSPLDVRVSDTYAQEVKNVIGSVADAAELFIQLTTFDEAATNQNARILQGLKMALQTRSFPEAQATLIQEVIESTGARFELDLP